MSTRSLIAMETKNGFEAVYCHSSGYPEHHAPILTEFYATPAKVAKLLKLGDLSCLGPRLGWKHDFNSHGNDAGTQGWCLAYGRDRSEGDAEKRAYKTEAELIAGAGERWADYIYLFRDGKWLYRNLRMDENWRELNV